MSELWIDTDRARNVTAAWAQRGDEPEAFDASGFLELVEPTVGLETAGFAEPGFEMAGSEVLSQEAPSWEAPVWEAPAWEAAAPTSGWASSGDASPDLRSSIAEAWEPYVNGGYSDRAETQPAVTQPAATQPDPRLDRGYLDRVRSRALQRLPQDFVRRDDLGPSG